MSTPIENFIDNYSEIKNFLLQSGQVSQAVNINEHYKKILLLSCASYYEKQITGIIKCFVETKTKDMRIISFLNNKAIQRQYHTYFNWEQNNNVNNFLGLFGSEFKESVSKEIKENDNLSKQVKAFLEIGSERNKMVHQNFLEYKLEKTFDEIVALHMDALCFIEYIGSKFK